MSTFMSLWSSVISFLTGGYPDGVVAGLDARRNVRDRLQPAGALAVHCAERHRVGDACPHLRHPARERPRAGLEHVAYTDLFCGRATSGGRNTKKKSTQEGSTPPSLHPTA